jgi:hypothetical protein
MTLCAQSAEQWMLMARHGECAEVASLKRKVPDLGEIRDPDAFAAHMRRKGFEVTSAKHATPKGKAQEVKVPAAELFLLFVTSELCSERGK